MVRRIILAALVTLSVNGFAQDRKIASPRDSVFLSLDTNVISVNYGRPSMRGRVIMGGLVPWNKVWRTGANQATHLKTNFDLTLGGTPVTKGTYTLWTLPSPTGWKIIVNKQTGQWGTAYDERQDFARFGAKAEALPTPVDTFTIALNKTNPTAGVLVLSWEKTRLSIPFEKDDRIRPLSPLDSCMTSINSKEVKIIYCKPFLRGRAIWGTVVPFDSVWRTGANAPTLLKTQTAIHVGNATLPAGNYVLRSVPGEETLSLLISKQPASPGPVQDSLLVAKIPMKKSASGTTIDPFRIWFVQGAQNSVALKIGWADREFTADITQ